MLWSLNFFTNSSSIISVAWRKGTVKVNYCVGKITTQHTKNIDEKVKCSGLLFRSGCLYQTGRCLLFTKLDPIDMGGSIDDIKNTSFSIFLYVESLVFSFSKKVLPTGCSTRSTGVSTKLVVTKQVSTNYFICD